MRNNPAHAAPKRDDRPAGHFALEFDGKSSVVKVDGLIHPLNTSLTWEAWIAPAADHDMAPAAIPFGDATALVRVESWNRGPVATLVTNGQNGIKMSFSKSFPVEKPFHLAVHRAQKKWILWINDKNVAKGEQHFKYPALVDHVFPATIGSFEGVPGGKLASFQGRMTEIRFSTSVRYTTNFTPSVRFEPDVHTLALYHCDEGKGDMLMDSSGNNHHGKITGGKWVRIGEP